VKKFPNAFIILLAIIFIAWILTYLIPQGAYERIINQETGREEVVNGSYHPINANYLSAFDMLLTIPKGIAERADLIVLILLIGGCFYTIEKTGALHSGLHKLVNLLKGKESFALILVSVLFVAAGATIALQEEIIGMIPVLLLFGRTLGYNAYTVIFMSFGSAVLGAAFSPLNPFAVLIAQREAQLPFLSGSAFRMVVMAIAVIVWITYLMRYARANRIKREVITATGEHQVTFRHLLILFLMAVTFGVVTFGLIFWEWSFAHMSACFFLLGFTSGILGKLGFNGTAETYGAGFKELIVACVIIGLAYSISLVLKEGNVIDSIVHGLFGPLQYLPPAVSAVIMMIGHSIFHIPVSSYSGQAIMTMPILLPLSDLIGISRQTCILAYQYGAVMMDMIIPTNGGLMAVLAVASIPYDNWMKFAIKPMLFILVLSAGAIVVAILIDFQ
jgi:uncharacterized ion transporter superfamily protein YfcC